MPLLSCFTVLPVTRVVQLARRCEEHGTPQHRCVVLQPLQPSTHTLPPSPVKAAADFNILGIISFSVFFAVVLSSLGPQAEPIINTINILNVAIERMVKAILSISPAGIASIIAARVISTCSLASMAERCCTHASHTLPERIHVCIFSCPACSMGLFMFTVLISLAIHTLAVLPLLYFILTRRNPYTFMRAMSQVS